MRIRPLLRQACSVCLCALLLCSAGTAGAEALRSTLGVDPWSDNFQSKPVLRASPMSNAKETGHIESHGSDAAAAPDRPAGYALRGAPVEDAPSSSSLTLRRSFIELGELEFTLRGRVMYVAALPTSAQKSSMGTGLGGEVSLDWRATEKFGPFVAVNYAGIGGITTNPNQLAASLLNNVRTVSYSNINSVTSYTLALATIGIFADIAPFKFRAGVGAGYGSINASYNSLTQTQLLLGHGPVARVSASGKRLDPARSWSLAGTVGVEVDLVAALALFGGEKLSPEGLSAQIGVEGIAGNAFLRPAASGAPTTRGALGFVALTGGASYAFPVSAPGLFAPARLKLPPSRGPAS
jgi:hypothetical protein